MDGVTRGQPHDGLPRCGGTSTTVEDTGDSAPSPDETTRDPVDQLLGTIAKFWHQLGVFAGAHTRRRLEREITTSERERIVRAIERLKGREA